MRVTYQPNASVVGNHRTVPATAPGATHNQCSVLRERVFQIREKARERTQRSEFLRFQINEINVASLKEGEKQTLGEERAILLNANKLRESAEMAYTMLYDSEGSGTVGGSATTGGSAKICAIVWSWRSR